jgi:hypothetical protein
MTRARLGPCLAAVIALLAVCTESHAGPIDPHRSLLITDAAVLTDPARTVDPCTGSATLPVWSLGYLMRELVAERAAPRRRVSTRIAWCIEPGCAADPRHC